MARMRSIKPEFFQDQDLAEEVPNRDARLLYIGLWGLADEHGRLRGDARSIKGQVFAYDDDLTPAAIDALIDMLARTGRAVRYRVEKATYLFLPKLADHQRLEPHKVPSRLPAPPDSDSFENFPDESAHGDNEFALKQAACSKEHVAGSSQQIADESAPLRSVPVDAEQATQLVIEATGCEPYLAAEAVLAIASERKPRNLPGLVRKLADDGELGAWLAKARGFVDAESVSSAIGAARASPDCPHGEPGGDHLHPTTKQPLCPLCRKGIPA